MLVRKTKNFKGQVMVEFTFCMVIILIMLWSMIQIMGWVSRDPVARRQAHYSTLRSGGDVSDQLSAYFYRPIAMNAVW